VERNCLGWKRHTHSLLILIIVENRPVRALIFRLPDCRGGFFPKRG
jgi:hypothetical protein